MRDRELTSLCEAAGGAFPPGLAGEEIGDVDLVLLDEVVMGVASHYQRNTRPLSEEHREWLLEAVADLDLILPELPTDQARDYFARTRIVADYLLEHR